MKKITLFFITFIIIGAFNTFSYAAKTSYKTVINNQAVKFTVAAFSDEKAVYLPVRETFELFGFQVNWDNNTKSVACKKDSTVVYYSSGNNSMKVNDRNIPMDYPAINSAGTLFVSSASLVEALGIKTSLSEKDKTIYLFNKNTKNISIQGDKNIFISGDSILAGITSIIPAGKIKESINEAEKLYSSGYYLPALKQYNKILKNISSAKNPLEYAKVMLGIGNCHIKIGFVTDKDVNAKKAISTYEEVLKNLDKKKYPQLSVCAYEGIAVSNILLAKVRDPEQNATKAVSTIDTALNMVDKTKNADIYASLIYNKAIAYQTAAAYSNSDLSKKYYKKSNDAFLESIKVYTEKNFPKKYAQIQMNLGVNNTCLFLVEPNAPILDNAVAYYNNALKHLTIKSDSTNYGFIQYYLGETYRNRYNLSYSDEDLNKSEKHYINALEVITLENYPYYYANMKKDLASLYVQKSSFDKAIACFENAADILTAEDYPVLYANLQLSLGSAYDSLGVEKESSFFQKAIICYNNALKVFTLEKYPSNYANTMTELGKVYVSLSAENDSSLENHEKAIECFENAMDVYSKDEPLMLAYTQTFASMPYSRLAKRNINTKTNIIKSIELSKEALKLFKPEYFSAYYGRNHSNLGISYTLLAGIEDKESNLLLSIQHFNTALTVYTKEASLAKYASVQKDLADSYILLSEVQKRDENRMLALKAIDEALIYYTFESSPSTNKELTDKKALLK